MSEKLIPKPMVGANETTAVAIIDKGQVKIGVARPNQHGLTDIFTFPGVAENRQLDTLINEARMVVPAILGSLELNDFSCQSTTQDRPDFTVTLQALAVEGIDQLLVNKGQRTQARPKYISQLGTSTRETVHTPHHASSSEWQNNYQPFMAAAGGISGLHSYRNLGFDQLKQLQAIVLPNVPLTAEKTNHNLLVAKAYNDHLRPRIEAANLNYEQVAELIVQGAESPEPVQETLLRSLGRKTKQLWNGK